ncbi:long-chain-fatty-acid--protein ligase [Neolewinella litorea]|uniref:Acyl transferase n=1 Tax=Neolewinella litorea TaxID=2562452 RepID=A0A4S4NS25_9BACT|nr:acyl transferase [Neolewinella litorea]THH42017.1 acyl transferase [Neolewinella litorea]
MTRDQLAGRIAEVTPAGFGALALDVFRYQAANNQIYAQYLELLRVNPRTVHRRTDIPHLPIALFKSYRLRSGDWQPVQTFTSSGTTGAATSRHDLRDADWYRDNAARTFERQYGPLRGRAVLALLPAYLERGGSSLVFMARDFMDRSGHPDSGFFLDNLPELAARLARLRETRTPTLLLGVSFALLELAERFPQPLGDALVMETGGMKGRRRELTRRELHAHLIGAFQVPAIHSEYGMTELLSQAYAPAHGRFYPAPTLSVTPRDITDPLCPAPRGRSAALNLTDLANLDTISFIASDDLGRVYADDSFEVLGRLDHSDIRGCNLLVSALA